MTMLTHLETLQAQTMKGSVKTDLEWRLSNFNTRHYRLLVN